MPSKYVPVQERAAREVVWNATTEADWMATVVALARHYGWHVYHTLHSVGSEAGFPDLVLVSIRSHMFVELKTMRGKLTDAQEEWITLLSRSAETHVWRPCDERAVQVRLARR